MSDYIVTATAPVIKLHKSEAQKWNNNNNNKTNFNFINIWRGANIQSTQGDQLKTMGSLPNLNELCREKEKRRAVEKERDLVRERARQQGFSRGDNNKEMAKDRLPMLFQVWAAPTKILEH